MNAVVGRNGHASRQRGGQQKQRISNHVSSGSCGLPSRHGASLRHRCHRAADQPCHQARMPDALYTCTSARTAFHSDHFHVANVPCPAAAGTCAAPCVQTSIDALGLCRVKQRGMRRLNVWMSTNAFESIRMQLVRMGSPSHLHVIAALTVYANYQSAEGRQGKGQGIP